MSLIINEHFAKKNKILTNSAALWDVVEPKMASSHNPQPLAPWGLCLIPRYRLAMGCALSKQIFWIHPCHQ